MMGWWPVLEPELVLVGLNCLQRDNFARGTGRQYVYDGI